MDLMSYQRASRIPASVRERWHRAGFHTQQTIGGLLEDSAARWPQRVAAITETGEVTFTDLARQSRHIATTLIEAGVQPGEAVSWLLPTGPEAIATAAAIWRIGAISSPLVPIYGSREITTALSQVRPTAIITSTASARRDYPDEFDEICRAVELVPRIRLLTSGAHPGWVSSSDVRVGSLPDRVQPATAEHPALVLFTSGTESEPKGVIHSVAGLSHELRSTVSGWGLTFRDRMVMASPMTHITGLLQGFMIPAHIGAAAILLERWDAEVCVEMIERHGATYMAGATPFLRELHRSYLDSGRGSSSLRQYCCGGASVPPDLIRDVNALGIAAYRAWGMTELPTATLPNEFDPLDARADTDGPLAPGVELLVVDDAGAPVGPGEGGELLIRGPEMMRGYVRADLDDRAFTREGWLRTGDLGALDADGRVRITGRTKDIINRGGEKLSAREIEEAIARHPDISAVAVLAVPGGRLGERVGAVVVSHRRDLTVSEVGAVVTEAGLARQKQPEMITVVDALPTNATGKIDRRTLRALFSDGDSTD
ncbi:class I adenylate-forming enzyme family protein [Gordonia jinghuaiqii]|nr:AMP-binding protein [Gordonia jinghuaiqii]